MPDTLFRDYFAAYGRCYDLFDAQQLADYFYVPTLMIKNGSVVTLATKEELHEHLVGLIGTYREKGLKKANLVELDVVPLGAWSAFATARWAVDRVDGTLLRDFRSSYNLFKAGDRWHITVCTNHDVPAS